MYCRGEREFAKDNKSLGMFELEDSCSTRELLQILKVYHFDIGLANWEFFNQV